MHDEIEEIKAAVKEGLQESVAQFYVERERHYQDHQFIGDLRELFDSVRGTATRTLVGIFITSIIGLVILGFVFWGKNHWGK